MAWLSIRSWIDGDSPAASGEIVLSITQLADVCDEAIPDADDAFVSLIERALRSLFHKAVGLEPTRVSPAHFERAASTNSATPARGLVGCYTLKPVINRARIVRQVVSLPWHLLAGFRLSDAGATWSSADAWACGLDLPWRRPRPVHSSGSAEPLSRMLQ